MHGHNKTVDEVQYAQHLDNQRDGFCGARGAAGADGDVGGGEASRMCAAGVAGRVACLLTKKAEEQVGLDHFNRSYTSRYLDVCTAMRCTEL